MSDLPSELEKIVERYSSPTERGSTPSTIVYRSISTDDVRAAVREAADAALERAEEIVAPGDEPLYEDYVKRGRPEEWEAEHASWETAAGIAAALRREKHSAEKTGGERG